MEIKKADPKHDAIWREQERKSMAEIRKYILKHKNIPVAPLTLDCVTGGILSVDQVFAEAHVPVGVPVKKGHIDRGALNEWWSGRAIPASRSGLKEALSRMEISQPQLLLEKCLGLSLSDQYWICPEESKLRWEEVNFFQNPFSGDVGKILFGRNVDSAAVSLMSPDNTSDGWLKKRWILADGKRCLIKGGSGTVQQEPYNEALASRLMERLNIPHVSYRLLVEDGYPYSICDDFITPDMELISAWYIMRTCRKPNHVSIYRHYLNCCETLGIPGIPDISGAPGKTENSGNCGMQEALDRMLVLDYLIVNEDRHQNNFGVIRNADTLEYLGAAPIYDSGTSLWFDKPTAMIRADAKTICKPFKTSHKEQIGLVQDFDWLDFSALKGIEEELRELVRGSLFIDEARCDALCRGLAGRVDMLKKHVDSRFRNAAFPAEAATRVRDGEAQETGRRAAKPRKTEDTRNDVKQDIAYSGKGSG